MKPSGPKPNDLPIPASGDTQVIDLQDVDLSDLPRGTAPPPLPQQFVAPPSGGEQARVSQPPPASLSPLTPASPPRTTGFYVMILLACLAVGIGGGVVVAMSLRKGPAPAGAHGGQARGAQAASEQGAAAPSAHPAETTGSAQPGVITIPVVEVQ